MEITLSVTLVFKIICMVPISGLLALITLLPINDQRTSRTQVLMFFILEAIAIAWMFNLFSISFTR